MALPIDITDPGTQQVPQANAGDAVVGTGLAVQVPAFVSVPASSGGNDVDGDLSGQTRPNQVNGNQAILRSTPGSNAGDLVQGGSFKPGGVPIGADNPGLASVEDQVFGSGLPRNVNVG